MSVISGLYNVTLGVLLLMGVLLLLGKGCALISQPNDGSVLQGLAILAVVWVAILTGGVVTMKQMYKKFGGLVVVLAALGSVGCGRTVVDPGYVGIEIDYYGTDRGVQSYPIRTGVVWYNPATTSVMQYPTFVQNAVWTHNVNEGNPRNEEITFTTGDSMKVSIDMSIAYRLNPAKVPNFYVKFRNNDLELFTHGFLRNLARDVIDHTGGKYKIEQIMGDNGPFLDAALEALKKRVEPDGVIIEQFGLIGAPRPPEAVIQAINAKVQATQNAIRVENEVRQTQAEAAKNVAQAKGNAEARIAQAEGEAKAVIAAADGTRRANELVNQAITANLLEWRRLDILQAQAAKWNGALPTTMVPGSALPFLAVTPKEE